MKQKTQTLGMAGLLVMLCVGAVSAADSLAVWNGEAQAGGVSWVSPTGPNNVVRVETGEAHSGGSAIEFLGQGSEWIGGGWSWRGWYPPGAGEDIRIYSNLVFWIKVTGDDPGVMSVALVSAITTKPSGQILVGEYVGDGETLHDGNWHEVVIPLCDFYAAAKDKNFDPKSVWEIDLNTWAPAARSFHIYLDDIGFDNRRVRPHSVWVTLPEARQPRALRTPVSVSAEIDLKSDGLPISPFIFGAAMGDQKAATELGLTIIRAGGNPISPFNWKQGFSSKGLDWFFVNDGTETAPENNWMLTLHRDNKKAGRESYLSVPMMGRVAKDGTSVAFDIRKYPDQESWAGKLQPADPHPYGGNGVQLLRDANGEIKKDSAGKPVTRLIEPDPADTSVVMTPDEQCDMLSFMMKKMNYGPASAGGVKYLALDNEPCLWSSTHRGIHPKGVSYDEYWERTVAYASRLKKIDPTVKIAGPTWFGWSAYFVSGLDLQLCNQGKGSWASPPDFTAHGKVPITKWWLKKLAEYEKTNKTRLVDILDFHFYPQTGIYLGGALNDPAVMESRVQETRVLWDPSFVESSWMADDVNGKAVGGKIQLIRMMKQWVAECNPGMQISLGEYNFGGEKDVSGGVAEAEMLGVFAREGVDFAFLWLFPSPNTSHWFAYKMFRNPDGLGTAFGDRYLSARVDRPDDVSVHVARDSKDGRLTFVLVNKRATRDARVTLKFQQSLPAQQVVMYEYSQADRMCIGRLPARTLGGAELNVDLPAMSVLRWDMRVPVK